MGLCKACDALLGQPAHTKAHPALELLHRQRVRDPSPRWNWFYRCERCDCQLCCTDHGWIAKSVHAGEASWWTTGKESAAFEQSLAGEPASMTIKSSATAAATPQDDATCHATPAKGAYRLLLPSGLVVRLQARSDGARRWEPHETGGLYTVRRPRLGNSGSYDVFKSHDSRPKILDKADADALANALNGGGNVDPSPVAGHSRRRRNQLTPDP
jgi:hypothetical protein